MSNKTAIIAQLNDEHRKLGAYCLTSDCLQLSHSDLQRLIKAVKTFDQFTEDNDPYQEHDFGKIEFLGEDYFWKIDYYSIDGYSNSEDPSDRAKTKRVLTVMRAEEY